MLPHAVEINGNNRHLCKEAGFLCVKGNGQILGRVPLDDLDMVLLCGHGTSLTANLLAAFAERSVPVITCNAAMLPVSITLPLVGHHLQSKRMARQIEIGLPQKKRLWQAVVRAKIKMQAQHLNLCGCEEVRLEKLARVVQSGDAANCEGAAAAIYWKKCFGPEFRRDRELPGLNAMLNYVYTVLRAATARAVILSGLHPAFGLFHKNSRNPMPLVDDLMEPFRPAADMLVMDLCAAGKQELDPKAKQYLVALTNLDIGMDGEMSTVGQALRGLAVSLAEVYEGTRKQLWLPCELLPVNFKQSEVDDAHLEQVQADVGTGDV